MNTLVKNILLGFAVAVGMFLSAGLWQIKGVPKPRASANSSMANDRRLTTRRLPNMWENLIKWIQTPQQIELGTAMLDLRVNKDEAHDITSYPYHEPAPW